MLSQLMFSSPIYIHDKSIYIKYIAWLHTHIHKQEKSLQNKRVQKDELKLSSITVRYR